MNGFEELGLTVSGGGTRGVVFIGALKALEEAKIEPISLVGSSAGAVIAAAKGAGYKSDDIFQIFSEFKPLSAFHPGMVLGQGLNYDKWVNYAETFLSGVRFDELDMPVALRAVEVKTKRFSRLPEILEEDGKHSHAYLDSGKVSQAVVASSAVFNPYSISDKKYRDGDLMPRTATEAHAKNGAQKTMVLNIKFPNKGIEGKLSKGFRVAQQRALIDDALINKPDHMVDFKIPSGSIFLKKRLQKDFDLGYRVMREYIESFLEEG